MATLPDLDHVWHWTKKLPDRKGDLCRVIASGNMNSILVEFADGHQVITSRHAVRPAIGDYGKQKKLAF